MLSINARSLAPGVNDWLANTNYPRILHVFDHVCNLINERGEILSLATPAIGNGPFNLVVEDDVFFSRFLSIESPISISQSQLILAGLTINTAESKLWNPCPDWETLHDMRDDILTQLMSLSVPDYQPSIPNSLVSDLTFSLTRADGSTAKEAASQLAGLGQGLTPSGDDILIGAIYATWILHPTEVADALAKEIANVAAPLTTSLSAAWLRAAGHGEAGVLWHKFFEALIFVSRKKSPMGIGNPTDGNLIQEAMDNILSIGETSGMDALAGFLAVFSAYKERIIDQCPS